LRLRAKQAIIAPSMDTRTLLVALLSQVSLLAALAIYFGARQRGTLAVGAWGAGLMLVAVGIGAISLRGIVPDLISITVANTLTMGANLFFYRALRMFRGKPVDDPVGVAALVATTVLIYLFSAVIPNFGARVVIVSSISALFFARNAIELGGAMPPEIRVSQQFMRWVYWTVTAVLMLRVVANIVLPPTDLMSAGPGQSSYFLAVLLLVTAGSFGMFWMEIQYLHLELTRQAARDSLTGMLNRRAFLVEFERELSRVRRGGTVLSVAMFDLDHFKRLNDVYGHPAGDEVLRSVAASMQACIRQPDILARYGGEEFALLMPDTDADMALNVAERIRLAVQMNGVEWKGERLSVTLSGGVAAYAANGTTTETLIAASDAALYEAKGAGRNRLLKAPPARPLEAVAVNDRHATP
jgi:diguanylate cyclase (GGDEF)-like protein